ncbi:hypothetical protein [Anaerobiospirillum succiniciproducens]|uniref:hypothetical protein n=1 Tax=Anaerobiospirillum succiniciproducens TaxID=13335 RepID=UPI003F8BAC5E
MKQTNNAIKFLMAQYRAIFKNANIAMVAAMAAAALSAGAANAANTDLDSKDKWDAALTSGNGTIEITGADADSGASGKYKNLKIEVISDTTDLSLKPGQKLLISDDKSAYHANVFSASGNGTKLNVTGGDLAITGLITASGSANQRGLVIKSLNSGSAKFKFENVQVDSVLHLATSGDSSAIDFAADNIVIGKTTLPAPGSNGDIQGRAVVLLGSEESSGYDSSGSIIFGDAGSVITVNKAGKLRAYGVSGGTTINASKVNVEGGILSFNSKYGSGKTNYNVNKTDVNGGWFSVKSVADLNLDLTPAGKITFAGKSTFDIGAITTLANGTIDVGAETVLAGRNGTTDANAQLKLGGTAGNDATLSINKQTLKSFLTAKAANGTDDLKYVDEHDQFKTPNNAEKVAASGALTIGSGGFLEIKDAADLATDFEFSGSAGAGKISVAEGGLVGGADITISAAVTAGDHLAVKATNLTLGKADAKLTDKLGVKSLEAENVTFINSGSDFNLLENLTLSTAGTGTISGGLVIGKTGSGATVTINGGNYTFEAGKNLETDATGKLELNNASKLDASGVANLKLASGAGSTATVQLSGGSTLVLDQTDVFKKGTGDAIDLVKDSSGSNITKEAISTDATSVLEFKLSDAFKGSGDKFTMTKEQVNNVKGALSTSGLTGVISFGNNFVLSGLSGDVALTEVIENADVYDGNGVNAENGTVDKSVVAGNISIGASADKATISNGKNVILYNAGNSGFVSKGGKAADVALSDTASLTLAGAGSIGAIDGGAANNGSVVIGHSKKETSAVVAVSIGATKAVKSVELQGKSTLTLTKENAQLQTQVLNVGDNASLVAEKQDIVVSSTGGSGSTILGNVTAKSVKFDAGTSDTDYVVAGGALLDVDSLVLSSSGSLFVGKDGTGTSAGHLEVGTLALKGGNLIVDPEWNADASIAHIKSMGGNGGSGDAIQLDGKLGVGKNSVLGFGFDSAQEVKDLFTTYGYMTADGKKLNKDKIQAALVLNKPLVIAANQGVMIDPSKTGQALKDAIDPTPGTTFQNKFEFGANSGLVITDGAYKIDQDGKKTGSAVSFAANAGSVSGSGKVVLAGYFTGADKDITIFSGSGLTGTGTVDLVSLNGLITAKVDLNTGKVQANTWNFATDKLATYYTSASKPVSDLLKDVMSGTIQGNTIGYKFLGNVANSNDKSGVLADAAAHAATYAGAQQAAVASVTTMADAMFGRVGAVGVEAASISATGSQANGGVWLTPMYKSVDADSFNAEGASYGADVDLGGVAFGADTVNGNMRFGAVFNIGSGDTEGKGNGNGLKDEFDYYGFGIYSAMGFGNFALVGDASMTVISHDVEGHGLKGKADTTAVTMGVTGQYSIATPVVDVTPHLGARFIRLNTDSYDLMSADGVLATTDFDVQNVFSVPLGVTLSKGFVAGGWTLAPSADLTVAFNSGDTEAKSKTTFTGVPSIDLTTEVLDEVTYGVSLGLGAQYGAFGTSFGINYTGSSNTDSFGVNAQARYMF